VGTRSNRNGIGTKVVLHGSGGLQYREMGMAGGHFSASQTGPLHFGLGESREIDALQIIWPDGRVQELNHLPANRIITVTEP